MIIYPDTCHVCDDQLPALFDIYDILYDIHASIAFCSHRISLPCRMLFSVYLFDYAATPQHPEAAASKSTHAQQRSSATTEMIHRIRPVGICGLCLLSILEILVIVHSVIFHYVPFSSSIFHHVPFVEDYQLVTSLMTNQLWVFPQYGKLGGGMLKRASMSRASEIVYPHWGIRINPFTGIHMPMVRISIIRWMTISIHINLIQSLYISISISISSSMSPSPYQSPSPYPSIFHIIYIIYISYIRHIRHIHTVHHTMF